MSQNRLEGDFSLFYGFEIILNQDSIKLDKGDRNNSNSVVNFANEKGQERCRRPWPRAEARIVATAGLIIARSTIPLPCSSLVSPNYPCGI